MHYILFYKPYGVLSQFTDAEGRPTLKDFGPVPADVYAAGRLDAGSEGLLLLTNNTALNHRLTEPRYEHPRTYLAQIEKIPSEPSLQKLRDGIVIEGKKTRPAVVTLLNDEPHFPPRPVPIRFRKSVPTAWIEITLSEGRNHQVRKMTAAIGHPTLRLVRSKIGFLTLEGLKPGKHRLLQPEEIKMLMESKKVRNFVA
ncbi:MAG: pseudouridine synthase [Ignavibacteriales bacterium]|nr:pseudouridine synthase [Ignavibacteriales bacterium]